MLCVSRIIRWTALQAVCLLIPSSASHTFSHVLSLLSRSLSHFVTQEFLEWCDRLFAYLQVLENRLFSEGLHVLGAPPSNAQMAQYLEVRLFLI